MDVADNLDSPYNHFSIKKFVFDVWANNLKPIFAAINPNIVYAPLYMVLLENITALISSNKTNCNYIPLVNLLPVIIIEAGELHQARISGFKAVA